jgi:hypothetical protein
VADEEPDRAAPRRARPRSPRDLARRARAHPSRQAARRLEDLLVAAGALPARDPALARMEEWIKQHLAGSAHESLLGPFAHWIVLSCYRRKSQHAPLNFGELGRAKIELVSATAFLDWLTDRERPLERCSQRISMCGSPAHGRISTSPGSSRGGR